MWIVLVYINLIFLKLLVQLSPNVILKERNYYITLETMLSILLLSITSFVSPIVMFYDFSKFSLTQKIPGYFQKEIKCLHGVLPV